MNGHIQSLPYEVLEKIWSLPVLSIVDIGRLASVCAQFREVSESNEVWKAKLRHRWRSLFESYPPPDLPRDWLEEAKSRLRCDRCVAVAIANLSKRCFYKEDVAEEEFAEFEELMQSGASVSLYAIDALREILADVDSHRNLTGRYYAAKALRFILHDYLRRECKQFLEQPASLQLLEHGATLMARWCQPSLQVSQCQVTRQLDDIAAQVRHHLQQRSSGEQHPACKASAAPTRPGAVESSWPPRQCRELLEALNHVLFSTIGFHGNKKDYFKPQNSFINKVLEMRTGIPITLSIVYVAVARRLGVVVQPVSFPNHFLVRWKEHPELDEENAYTYIDVYGGGTFLAQNECHLVVIGARGPPRDPEAYRSATPHQVFERMVRNLVLVGRQHSQRGHHMDVLRDALELGRVLCPCDRAIGLQLVQLYAYLSINLNAAMSVLEELEGVSYQEDAPIISSLRDAIRTLIEEERNTPEHEVKVKKRSENTDVEYSVGMIMRHRRYNYLCVIYGWDPLCKAGIDWVHQMGVHLLPKKQKQPFYNVLVNDGSARYAAEENLVVAAEPNSVDHMQLGKYFQEYCGAYYVPNAEKALEYPEDAAYTQSQAEGR